MPRLEDANQDRLTRAGVTEREADVLWAVAERRRNREIADRLHVSVRTVESHVAALMRKLDASDRGALAEMGTQLRRASGTTSGLRAPLTSLIGRDRDRGEVATLLAAHRLVTLIGPGGVGKTRLALRVAVDFTDRFTGGIRVADLAPVQTDFVSDAFARALGVVPEPGWSLPDIWRDVAPGTPSLLLADNCEHVVADVAGLVEDLLAADENLHVLATSREPLGITGEATYPVSALAVPPPEAIDEVEVGNYDAVRLFVDRASTASPGFTLNDTVAPAVAALCQRLDGLPLAIELAASRIRTFPPAELVEHLDKRFELLSGGARTAARRHRTLRGAIDWSYDLLDDDERALFDRLGVFPADFDFDAVQSISPAGPAVIEILPRLVDKSLVSTVDAGVRRYRLLETLRDYAAERLSAADAEPDARARHAAHYVSLAEHAARRLETAAQRTWLDRLSTEQPNLRAALRYTTAVGDSESAWRLIGALQRYWDVKGQRPEAHEWIQRTLAIGEPTPTPATVAGLAGGSAILHALDAGAAYDLATKAAHLATDLGPLTKAKAARAIGMSATWVHPERVRPALDEALAGFGHDHPWDRALTMQGLASNTAALSEALQWGRDCVGLFRSVGDQMYAANTLFIMAQRAIYAGIGDEEVEGWLVESQALAEAAGSEGDMLHAAVGFAQLAWLRGDHDAAADRMGEQLPTLRRLGDRRCAGRALFMLGDRARVKGELDRAEELLQSCVEAIAVAGQSFVLVWALEGLAAVFAAKGQPRRAAVILGVADRARDAASAHMRPIQPPDEHLRDNVRQTLGATAYDDLYRGGGQLAPSEALTLGALDEAGNAAG
jgi:predicted ATPase/DNA-binding CsgD family transcriptional regulator